MDYKCVCCRTWFVRTSPYVKFCSINCKELHEQYREYNSYRTGPDSEEIMDELLQLQETIRNEALDESLEQSFFEEYYEDSSPYVTDVSEDKYSELFNDELPAPNPIPVNDAPTSRGTLALQTLTPETIENLFFTGVRYSSSTLKNHAWVEKLYYGFCSALNAETFPLSANIVSAFIKFLGFEAKYALTSIECVIIPSLKRLHYQKCQQPPSDEILRFIKRALQDIKKSKSYLGGKAGREPVIVPDIKRIIECTPDGLPTKAEEASLWLVALSTGARAVTCLMF